MDATGKASNGMYELDGTAIVFATKKVMYGYELVALTINPPCLPICSHMAQCAQRTILDSDMHPCESHINCVLTEFNEALQNLQALLQHLGVVLHDVAQFQASHRGSELGTIGTAAAEESVTPKLTTAIQQSASQGNHTFVPVQMMPLGHVQGRSWLQPHSFADDSEISFELLPICACHSSGPAFISWGRGFDEDL